MNLSTRALIKKIRAFFLDILYPSYCFSCQKFLKTEEKYPYLCLNCLEKIPLYSSFFCPICFKRISNQKLKKCSQHASKSFLDFLGAATDYQGVVKELILAYKYQFAKEIAFSLAQILINYLKKAFPEPLKDYLFLAIPLHPSRERWRGFNQSKEIAKILSGELKIEFLKDVLYRKKKTKPQVELKNFQERKENLSEAFWINPSKIPLLQKKKIILIDDVFTSGATLQSAAKILKETGAKRVIGLVIAK